MPEAVGYTNTFMNAGFTREEAEASFTMTVEIMNKNFATKDDLKMEGLALRHEMSEIRHEMREMHLEINKKFESLEDKLTIKLGSMMVLSVIALASLQKIL